MLKVMEQRKQRGVLVAAHRGTSGGNIPPNTTASFDIALKEGADILELDLFRSVDGKIFVFHTGMEPSHLDRHIYIQDYKSEEIKEMRLCNGDLSQTFLRVNSFEEILERYKGKCILNLDRCIDVLDDVMKEVNYHNMADQILLKSAPSEKALKMVEAYAPTVDYMPIYKQEDSCSEKIERMNIHFVGAELVFSDEKAPVIQESYIDRMHKKGKVLWGNSILYSSRVPLSAGHSDDVSLMDDPAKGWGWLADKGFDIIQTDWTQHCSDYLIEKGVRKGGVWNFSF